ncbi:transglycosylase family protein [Streptomyces sp. NPDC004787]|uniref:transglycosylase family protein n=1 Tax=Streptomyces sp. NPDC004787 TaxID=3154291 RepID=UPI0033AEAE05
MRSRTAAARRRRSRRTLLAAGVSLPILLSTAPVAFAVSSETWDRVAACESSGNWNINTGNGFYGGLQFLPSTWAEYGGLRYAQNAHEATKEQQIEIAEKVLAVQGPDAWPHCSKVAGLADSDTSSQKTEIKSGSRVDQQSEDSQNAALVTTDQAASSSSARITASAPVVGANVTTAYRQAGSWAAGYHTGVDFAVPTGTAVRAVTQGTVISAGWAGSYGNAVVLRHPDGMYTLYAHLSSVSVGTGQNVAAAQQIGLSGSTGNSTGPHLHFEARTRNSYHAHVDPIAYLRSLGLST